MRVYPNSQRGMEPLLYKAKYEGMNVAIHWMDKDSSSAKAIGQHYPDTKLMLCGGHAACAHEKALKKFKQRKALLMIKRSPFGGNTPMWTLLNATVHITQEWMWLHIRSVYNCGTKQVF